MAVLGFQNCLFHSSLSLDASFHGIQVSSLLQGHWYQAQRMVLHTVAAAACLVLLRGQWHLRGTCLLLWPCVWCLTAALTTQLSVRTPGSFCTGGTEHQLFLLSAEMQEGQGANPCLHGGFMTPFALPIVPQALP